MMFRLRRIALPLSLALLGACSKSGDAPPPAAPAVPQVNAQLAKEVAMYEDLLKSGSYELAAPIGQDIVRRFPDSPAAAQVKQTLGDTEAKAEAIAKKRRVERLWAYQTGTSESGGTQNTASIYSSGGRDADRIRLVLRRHSQWGLSVYLFGSGKGFACRNVCTLPARIDGQSVRVEAYLPETGEPALFIKDEKGFVARLEKAGVIELEATLKEGGKHTFEFEVGGYDPARFPELAKKK
ncbi:hypothetical protein [Dokdonella koreensis]|uniref:hypothetical protein n=1 Tax=Dokdonella koreensis TaxID=323415 RepID=UPI000829F1F2|nr:hypothetical protein [Dokdonella koreensis]